MWAVDRVFDHPANCDGNGTGERLNKQIHVGVMAVYAAIDSNHCNHEGLGKEPAEKPTPRSEQRVTEYANPPVC
jgi:hypothetical protein